MTAQPKSVIKSYFETGDVPSQAQFVDLIDSYQDVGAGGAVTGPISSVDSQIALFSGTTGGVLKAASTTGLLKGTSGVISAATSGTDYAPPTSGSNFLKGNSGGGFTNQSTINLSDLSTQGGATLVANATGGTAAPTAVSVTTDLILSTTLGVNTGTGANQILKLNGSSQIPAVDGSLLTGISSSLAFLGARTASTSASLEFASAITSSYDYYMFVFKDIRPATNGTALRMLFSTDNGSNYNASNNTTAFNSRIPVDGTTTAYANSAVAATTFFTLMVGNDIGSAAAEALSGKVELFVPNSSTAGKRIEALLECGTASIRHLTSSYTTLTTAINAVKFQMASGNITSGTIYMYGIKNS